MLARPLQHPVREIRSRTSGHPHGPITRLMSPGDLGELIKPFVFLDLFGFDGRYAPTPMDFGWHPHSGIATVTVMLEGSVRYAETTGKEGILPAGGVEWMRAGGGVWHTGAPEMGRVRGFQLWVALPPELENAANASHYVMPKDVPTEGPARVILGAYGGLQSPIAAPPMNYLSVSLKAGERWTYHPPQGHTVAWVAVHEGVLRAPSPIPSGELAIFEPSERSIDFVAEGATVFVLGSAAKHPHDLVLGSYSVHTSADALRQGEAEIRRIGHQLRANGTLRR
jgi:redox-sensitive bicupin YhaK (pirin superfamily)